MSPATKSKNKIDDSSFNKSPSEKSFKKKKSILVFFENN
jgi:hypothetical protein